MAGVIFRIECFHLSQVRKTIRGEREREREAETETDREKRKRERKGQWVSLVSGVFFFLFLFVESLSQLKIIGDGRSKSTECATSWR